MKYRIKPNNSTSKNMAIKDYTSIINLVEMINLLIDINLKLGCVSIIVLAFLPAIPFIICLSPLSPFITFILTIIPILILYSVKYLFRFLAINKQKELSVLFVTVKCRCKEYEEYKRVIDETECLWKYSHYEHLNISNLLDD